MYIECIGDDLMNELVISIKNAYKKFGEQVVLNDVSLEIYKGRIYGMVEMAVEKQSYLKAYVDSYY